MNAIIVMGAMFGAGTEMDTLLLSLVSQSGANGIGANGASGGIGAIDFGTAFFPAMGGVSLGNWGMLGILTVLLGLCGALLFCWRLVKKVRRLERQLQQQQGILDILPIQIFACDQDGTLLFVHTQEEFRAAACAAGKVQYLPEMTWNSGDFSEDLHRVFDSGKELWSESDSLRRRFFFHRLEEHVFGRSAVCWCSWNIAGERQKREEYHHRLSQYRATFDAVSEGLIATDLRGCVTEINESAVRLLECVVSMATGHLIDEVFCLMDPVMADRKLPSPVFQTLKNSTGVPWQENGNLRLLSGAQKQVAWSVAPIFGCDGSLSGAVLIFRENGEELKRREREVTQRQALEQAAELTHSTYFRYNVRTRITSGGASLPQFWGFRNGLPLPELEWVYAEDAQEFLRRRNELLAGRSEVFDCSYRSNRMGTMRYYQLRAILEKNGGDPVIFGVIQDVTSRQEMLRRNMENAAFIKILTEALPCPFFVKEISNGYRYVLCSNAWLELMKKTLPEVEGHDDFEIFADTLDVAKAFREYDNQSNAASAPIQRVEHVVQDGKNKFFHTIEFAYNIPDGKRMLFGICLDVTEVEETKMRESEMREFYQQILDHLPAAVKIKDPNADFRYIVWNRALEQHTGYAAEDVIGKNDFEVAPFPGMQQSFRNADLQLMETQKSISKIEPCTSAIGHYIYYRTTKSLIRYGSKSYIVELALDMTREKELEVEREEMIRKLNTHIASETLINHCLKRITVENDFIKAVSGMLGSIGNNIDADRCYICRYRENLDFVDCWCEWVREGISAQKGMLQNLDMRSYHSWQTAMLQHHPVIFNDVNALSDENSALREILVSQQIRSLLVLGIYHNDKLIGFLGIDYVRRLHRFTDYDVKTLQNAVAIFLLAYERKLQFDKVESIAAMQKMILNMMSIPILLLNRDFTVAHANPAVCELYNLQAQDSGKKCYDLICHNAEEPEADCMVRQALHTESLKEYETQIGDRTFRVQLQPIVQDGVVMQVLACFVDLTEEKRSKALLKKTVTDAEEAARAKSLFLATMSHELRTPLNAVIGFAELLEVGGMDEKTVQESIRSIHIAGDTLLSLINDVLDLSKLEAGQMKIVPVKVDLCEMLDELHRLFSHKLQAQNLRGTRSVPDDLPMLYLDPLRLRQVLLNLLGNAVKFTHVGGVDVAVEFTPSDQQTGILQIHIKDTGIGVSPEYLQKIFEPFIQQEMRGSRSYQGTGLGLPICKRLIEQMGGVLTLQSEVGKGSCFSISLPGVRFEVAEKAKKEKRPKLQLQQLSGTVLLIDDVPMNLAVLKAMAEKLSLKTLLATSGKEALEVLKHESVDVVMTDLWMPGMNGMEFAEAVRKESAWKQVRLIAVTADTEVEVHLQRKLFDGVLLKPITLEKLQDALICVSENSCRGGGGYAQVLYRQRVKRFPRDKIV